MRINIPQIAEKCSKRHAQFLTKSPGFEILNNYCGLRQQQTATILTRSAHDFDKAFNPAHEPGVNGFAQRFTEGE